MRKLLPIEHEGRAATVGEDEAILSATVDPSQGVDQRGQHLRRERERYAVGRHGIEGDLFASHGGGASEQRREDTAALGVEGGADVKCALRRAEREGQSVAAPRGDEGDAEGFAGGDDRLGGVIAAVKREAISLAT